eukprot:1157731-Pelagomonas_calceolata.AAC.1
MLEEGFCREGGFRIPISTFCCKSNNFSKLDRSDKHPDNQNGRWTPPAPQTNRILWAPGFHCQQGTKPGLRCGTVLVPVGLTLFPDF